MPFGLLFRQVGQGTTLDYEDFRPCITNIQNKKTKTKLPPNTYVNFLNISIELYGIFYCLGDIKI